MTTDKKTQSIPPSELILNPDGSVYHLNLQPEQLAQTVILVGDPGRVPRVSKYFDKIEHQISKREFVTHTGWVGKKRISVVSSGIGTDNIDIVLNELDALVNIDLKSCAIKAELTSLDLIRIGTSGSMNRAVPVDAHIYSAFGLGLENLMSFYPHELSEREKNLKDSFMQFAENQGIKLSAYAFEGNAELARKIGKGMYSGITFTSPGFYGPQGRELRLKSILGKEFFEKCASFSFEKHQLTNFEMETSGIYGLAKMMGHRALSCNAIIAQRLTNEFSKDPKAVVDKLIRNVLEKLAETKI
jgi:uridine phosphorylase